MNVSACQKKEVNCRTLNISHKILKYAWQEFPLQWRETSETERHITGLLENMETVGLENSEGHLKEIFKEMMFQADSRSVPGRKQKFCIRRGRKTSVEFVTSVTACFKSMFAKDTVSIFSIRGRSKDLQLPLVGRSRSLRLHWGGDGLNLQNGFRLTIVTAKVLPEDNSYGLLGSNCIPG